MRDRLTRRSEENIIEIYLAGIAAFGETQAEKYHAGLVRAFDFIASNPLAARERREASPPVRLHIHGAHVIAYLGRTSDVLVIRILHGRRDWQRHLS